VKLLPPAGLRLLCAKGEDFREPAVLGAGGDASRSSSAVKPLHIKRNSRDAPLQKAHESSPPAPKGETFQEPR